MKTLLSIIFFCSCLCLAGQVTVSTLSSEIKGSGGLSLDGNGNLIIADFGDFLSVPDPDGQPNDILIMDLSTNDITTYAGGFGGASGNDFRSNGILYQSDIRESSIFRIVNGSREFITNTGIVAPVGIVFDSSDNFYVCNCGNDTIQKVTPAGDSTTFSSGSVFDCPNGITIDEDDNLYVSNFNNGSIIKITPGGDQSIIGSTPGGSTSGSSNGHLDYHESTRTLFIASHGSNKIFALRIDDPGNLIPIAGSGARGNADGSGETASFSRPNGVAVTEDGDALYVNSAVPVTNTPNGPLNPQLVRYVSGIQSIMASPDFSPSIQLNISPNPALNTLFLNGKLGEPTALEIVISDISGKQTYFETLSPVTELNHQIDVNSLRPGLYILTVRNSHHVLLNHKLVKK